MGARVIDVKIMKDYVIRKEDSNGVLVPELSLLHMMESCSDFASEVSQLEHVAESLGAKVIITTKYHAEYAGEDVEYSWGFYRCVYCRFSLAENKGRDNFCALVNKCISR